MAKTSIYLPDDLAEQVRAHGIPVSEVAQDALRRAVREAEIKENAMTDIQAVADRMKGISAERAKTEQTKAERIRGYGIEWAREDADAAELEYLATYDGPAADFMLPTSIVFFTPPPARRFPAARAARIGPISRTAPAGSGKPSSRCSRIELDPGSPVTSWPGFLTPGARAGAPSGH
jgi:post-segregation antitoxin (ccd killing protein)